MRKARRAGRRCPGVQGGLDGQPLGEGRGAQSSGACRMGPRPGAAQGPRGRVWPEVRQLDLPAVGAHQHVLGLEVPVHQPKGVDVLQGGSQLGCAALGGRLREAHLWERVSGAGPRACPLSPGDRVSGSQLPSPPTGLALELSSDPGEQAKGDRD